DEAVHQVGGAEAEANPRGDAREPIRRDPGDALGQRACATAAQGLDEQADLDVDRARRGAESAGGAGLDAVVVVERLHLGQALRLAAVGLEPRDLAPADDALARRQRQPARRALRLAEA